MRAALLVLLLAITNLHAAPPRTYTPDPASVQWCGPAYRYPQQGWIVVHIEGKPYERGYQYGTLLAKEIVGFIDATGLSQSPKAPSDGWRSMRTLTDALFLRRYDAELLEEMKGIADGAACAGCTSMDCRDVRGVAAGATPIASTLNHYHLW